MKIPLVAIVPITHYELLAQIGRSWLEQLKDHPDDSPEYKEVLDLLTDWDWWDSAQRERGEL